MENPTGDFFNVSSSPLRRDAITREDAVQRRQPKRRAGYGQSLLLTAVTDMPEPVFTDQVWWTVTALCSHPA
jgi:hypothetical protein